MVNNLLLKAFTSLFPDKEIPSLKIRFSGRFKPFNANVSISKKGLEIKELVFSLSKKFIDCEDEIKIGLFQFLLNKVYATSIPSLEQDLYFGFTKRLNKYSKNVFIDEELSILFDELNNYYFNGLLDKTNLRWGGENTTVLGNYNFSTDTITISSILKGTDDLLRYVLYHEMLHKKHGFIQTGSVSRYHTKEFRLDEKKFLTKDIEKKLERFVAKKKIKNLLFKW